MNKWCRQCEQEVRMDDYYRHPRTADGLMPVCKACHRTNVKANRTANAEYYREFDKSRANLPHRVSARRTYAQTPEGKTALARGSAAWARRNPVKKAATSAVNNCLRDGKLTSQPCEVCGNTKAQAHHDDYDKPLEIRWLCTTHHAEWHRHNTPKCPPQEKAA